MGYPGVLEVPDATRRIDAIPPMMVGGPAERVAVGTHAICAVLKGGSVRCWGAFFNADWDWSFSTGVYGSSSGYEWYEDSIPAQLELLKLGGPASNVAVGHDRACALVEGSVECWGGQSGGALGHGLDDPDATDFPAQRPGEAPPIDLGGRVVALAAASQDVCGLRDDGAVFCWGGRAFDPNAGALGKPGAGVIGDDETPAEAGPVEIGAPAVDVVMGSGHVCALLENGAVRCFGRGWNGQLGYGNTQYIGDNETPESAGDVPLGGTAVQISVGANHTCALLDTGGVRCWGENSYRQLGYGHTEDIGDDETPASVGDVPLP
jgi:alpha-tubulin suppressor-like RCC1 family protein